MGSGLERVALLSSALVLGTEYSMELRIIWLFAVGVAFPAIMVGAALGAIVCVNGGGHCGGSNGQGRYGESGGKGSSELTLHDFSSTE